MLAVHGSSSVYMGPDAGGNWDLERIDQFVLVWNTDNVETEEDMNQLG